MIRIDSTKGRWLCKKVREQSNERSKKASLVRGWLRCKIPAKPTFALVSTIIGLASLTFVFGMGTRVSSQVIYRETAEGAAEPPVSA